MIPSSWYLFGFLFKISDECPHPFYIGVLSQVGGGGGIQVLKIATGGPGCMAGFDTAILGIRSVRNRVSTMGFFWWGGWGGTSAPQLFPSAPPSLQFLVRFLSRVSSAKELDTM